MDIKEVLRLVDEEWEMFQRTNNIGGRAPWNDEIISSCLNDMSEARKQGRNLIAEKYGYMMQFADFVEYFRLAFMLPSISEEKISLVRKITDKTVMWAEVAKKKYPAIASNGRLIHAYEGDFNNTSIETYCYGEMLTHSIETLRLISDHYDKLAEGGENLWIIVQTYLVRMLGYSSLDDAEEKSKSCLEELTIAYRFDIIVDNSNSLRKMTKPSFGQRKTLTIKK